MQSEPLTTSDLERIPIQLGQHRTPRTASDHFAYHLVQTLRRPADWFFAHRYIHRAMLLETVAAIPGSVAGLVRHLKSLRTMHSHNDQHIAHLLHEAENERMHLVTWVHLSRPTLGDRALVYGVQFVFFQVYAVLYIAAPKVAHRVVGYLEEEAVKSYTGFLEAIDDGRIDGKKEAPEVAKVYWNLSDKATVRDVVLAVRADEATHRDVNHALADE
jgi:hypothetical protein